MSYLPVKLISVKRGRLTESDDLTQPLSAYVQGEHYLVVVEGKALSCLSIGRILNRETGLDLTKPLNTVLNARLTDFFVNSYIDRSIPIKSSSGLYERRLNVFNPLTCKDFEIYFTSDNTPDVKNDPKKKGFLDDLALKSDEDMSNYLVAVNGVFHRTILQGGVLYVLDGFRTVRLSGRKDILVVDTKGVGGHTIVPLTKDNVTKAEYQGRAIVTAPASIAGKTVFAVIDGYFCHHDHGVLSVEDNTHLGIHTNKLPLIQQFRHNPRTIYKPDRYGLGASQQSKKYNDTFDTVFMNKKQIPTSVLANKEFQYSRLTNFHSFLVVFNNPNLFTVSMDVLPTGTPKLYYDASSRRVSGILNYGCGLSPSYLIWNDSFDRKSIFLSDQDYDVDRHDQSINPAFIPVLTKEIDLGSQVPAQFFDYVTG